MTVPIMDVIRVGEESGRKVMVAEDRGYRGVALTWRCEKRVYIVVG